ncbi:MAG: transposase [Methylotenera sp.]|nr:transposase [Oligoflexia bacterium]
MLVVVMDLSETYRSIVRKYFPNAMIVADLFHVVRLLNHHFLKVWGVLDPAGRKSRGLLSLLRRHECNLKPDQIPKLQKYFDEIPGLEALYRFKQDLMQLLLKKHQRRREAKDLIPLLLWHMNECLQSAWEPMKTFGQTLKSWLEPIVHHGRVRFQEFQELPTQSDCTLWLGWSIQHPKLILCKIAMPHVVVKSLYRARCPVFK